MQQTQQLTKDQAKQILTQLIDNSRLTKPEYDLLMQAIEVLIAPLEAVAS